MDHPVIHLRLLLNSFDAELLDLQQHEDKKETSVSKDTITSTLLGS